MANQKLASKIIGKIFRNPDMQYGLSVFEGINPEQVLDFSEKDGKYYLQCLKRNKNLVAKPEEIIRHAVSGMLPQNRLRDKMLARLFIFGKENHPYESKFKAKISKLKTEDKK